MEAEEQHRGREQARVNIFVRQEPTARLWT
jgi:hypothetical protein